MIQKLKLKWLYVKSIILHENTEKFGIFISVIISALSLLALASPMIEKILDIQYADLQASIVESSPSHLSLVIANNGNSVVAIKQVQVISDNVATKPMQLKVGNPLIKPNEASIVSTGTESIGSNVVDANILNVENPLITKMATVKCKVKIEYVIPGKSPEPYELEVKCFAACIQKM